KYHGPEKDCCFADLRKGKLEIVITTFETFRDKVEQLNQVEWEAVIVDEVHKIKGLRAQVTQALRIIKTPCRFGLTGTALQNNMTELWSLLDWAQPKILGTLEQFDNIFVKAIETGQKCDATKRELAHARKQRDKFASIRRKMLLRRTKKLIANQMPNKEELVVMCRLTDLQTSVYKAILGHPDMHLVLQAEDPCDCKSGKQRASCCYKRRADGTKVWGLVFSFMHLMLKAANHVGLLIPDSDTTDNVGTSLKEKPGAGLAQSVFRIAFRDQPQFVELTRSAAFRTLSDPRYCGKMKILQGLLHVFEKNHDKVLIFSYSTKLLDIIEQYVIGQGFEYSRIDGKVSGQRRRDIVLKFNTDPSLFICLISTKAGGLGLNLTGANRVVIFDPNWNPSHDLQAQDRAYRIGQTRDVKVFRLVSAGTIEENIYLRQIYKQQLDEVAIGSINARRYFHGIQGDKTNQGELFGIKNMFALRTGDVCLTMDILKRNERLEQGLAGFDITKYIPPKTDGGSTTDAQNSEEEDEIDDRKHHESEKSDDERSEREEKEEDEQFLRDIFGKDHIRLKPSSSTSLEQSSRKMTTKESSSDNSDEDEFSFFPSRTSHRLRKHSKKANLPQRSKDCDTRNSSHVSHSISEPIECAEAEHQSKREKTALYDFDDLFDMSDITFSTTKASAKSFVSDQIDRDKLLHLTSKLNFESKNPDTSSKKSGISWPFPGSDCETENSNDDLKGAHNKGSLGFERVSERRERNRKEVHQMTMPSKRNAKKVASCKKKGHSRQYKPQDSKLTKSKPSFSSEQSLLAASNVLHTHTNAGVLGTSKAEDHMTHCAIKDVYELNTNTQALALVCDPLSHSEDTIERAAEHERDKCASATDSDSKRRDCKKGYGLTAGSHNYKSKQAISTTNFYYKSEKSCNQTTISGDISKTSRNSADGTSQKREYKQSAGDTPRKKKNEISPSKQKRVRGCNSKAPTPFFLEANTLASDSQESVTAVCPQFQPSLPALSDDDDDDEATEVYHPISPPPKKKPSPFGKVSPLRSQHRTRLRYKREGIGRESNNKIAQRGDENPSKCTDLPHNASFPQKPHTVLFKNNQPDEDIATLLNEIGQPSGGAMTKQEESSKLPVNDCETQGNLKSVGEERDILCHSEFETKGNDTLSAKMPAKSIAGPSRSSIRSKVTPIRRRTPVSLLDDIFGESFPLPSDNVNGKYETKGGITSDKKRDITSETEVSKANKRQSPVRGGKSVNRAPDEKLMSIKASSKQSTVTSDQNQTKVKNHGSLHTKPHQANATINMGRSVLGKRSATTSFHESSAAAGESESELFDDLFTQSTLREESHSHSDVSHKARKVNERPKRSYTPAVKSSRKLFEEDKGVDLDFDDLEKWSKFNRRHSIPSDSESLFS
ncbi:DNA excision repair protein ercc-6-like 2, partial [Plakobranchus ocellatus]